MLRSRVGIFLMLAVLAPTPGFTAPDSANKDENAAIMEKLQLQLKEAALLEVQAWRLASQFYLYGAQGRSAAEMTQLQKFRSTGARMAGRTDSKVQSAWEQLAAAVADGELDTEGKPSAATHKRLTERLEAFTMAMDSYVQELRKGGKLPPKSPAEGLKDTAIRFEGVVLNHLSGADTPEHRKQLAQLGARFESLDAAYPAGESGKAVQEACKKWPVLREAMLKGKDKNPVFIISRFHEQVAEDLNTALNALPRY